MPLCIQISRTGGAEQLQLADLPVGQPGPGQVRIRHHAIGVNFIDVYVRSGLYPMPLPVVPGQEGAGVIEAVGAGVEHLRVGDRAAYASAAPGSYAEQRVLDAMTVCRLPDDIDFDTAAAVMLKGLTVQMLLRRTLPAEGLQAQDAILWQAAAGGVGLIACQWARALGLRLIGTAGSDEKCRLALVHGAWAAINYRAKDFVAEVERLSAGQGVKVVYDAVGKDTWDGSLACLRRFGLMASFGNASGAVPPFAPLALAPKGLYVTRPSLFTHLSTRERCQQMADELFAVLRSGAVRPHIAQRFALADAAQAHRALQSRQTTGSTILTVG